MKRILVTGGAGFLGSHLCRLLLKNGEQVVCLDNLYTGSKKNIVDLLSDKNFSFVKGDINKSLKLTGKFNQIYNLACPASPIHYQNDPVSTIKASTIGVMNLCELAKKHKARILQTSTSEVYGNPLVHPQVESYWGNVNPNGLRACYDEGKRVAEAIFFEYHRQFGVDVRIVRLFNTYGPNMAADDGRVVSNFIVQALNGQDITIYGKGKQTRSFCFVSDTILGIYKMMNKTGFAGPVNIGNPTEKTMIEIAKEIIKITKSKSKLVFRPLPADDPIKRKPDISLAKAKLNWEPKILLHDGLIMTVNYFSKK